MSNTISAYRRWLQSQLKELDELEVLEEEIRPEGETWPAWIIQQASIKANALGLPIRPKGKSITDARIFIAECLQGLPQDSNLLTVQDASEQLGVSQRTVYDLVRSGKLSCQRFGKGRGTIRFRTSDLTNYRSESEQPKFKHLRL